MTDREALRHARKELRRGQRRERLLLRDLELCQDKIGKLKLAMRRAAR